MQNLLFTVVFMILTNQHIIADTTLKGKRPTLVDNYCNVQTWTSVLNGNRGSNTHVAALVLARGGSKGIHLKNIVVIKGISLLRRSLIAIHKFGKFSSVWVSTDNNQIADEARLAGALVHWRSVDSATDSASSILGIQDFLESHPEVDVIGLVQCTSPFLEANYLAMGYDLMASGRFDSVFSVKREFKLRWQESSDGILVPLNFDIKSRPRRQNWSGELIENGMFYFTTKELIQRGLLQGGRIIRAVTDALCDIAPQFIRFPMTVAEQTHTKHQFYRINHFPNVLGAIDGTHINIKRPPGEHPEQYVNRHGRFSMNVMAVCDANLKFLNVYADYPGSNGDGYIWAASELGAAFRNGAIVDGWLLGDSAYPLQPWLMTPLQNPNTDAEHGYNRAHKKTRSTIERSFGLLKSRFRCLDDSGGDLCYSPLRVCKITKACCVLHNICCDARIEMVVDEGVALRVAAMANGPPRAIQRAGAGMAVQRRLIDNHQWLPPQNV